MIPLCFRSLPRALASRRSRLEAGKNGFTLIELLIVIAIILLLTALLIPSFIGFLSGRKLRSGAARIESMVNRAKSEAIRTRRMHYIVFDRYNHRLALVDAGINGRSDLEDVRENGEIVFVTGSDDRNIPIDSEQSAMPEGCYLARTSISEDEILFSETLLAYPDGSLVTTGRPDVATVTYLDGDTSRGEVGGDIVLTLGELVDGTMEPVFGPPEESGDERRGCFIDITPTTGRVRYEIDTWKRDYHN